MEVILLERVEKLGQIGDVVTVKNGFARNYLLPRNKALRANETNRKLFEANKAKIVADNDAKRKDAEAASKGIDGASVTLIRQASNTGQLYGSVAVRDIVEDWLLMVRRCRSSRSCWISRSRPLASMTLRFRCTRKFR